MDCTAIEPIHTRFSMKSSFFWRKKVLIVVRHFIASFRNMFLMFLYLNCMRCDAICLVIWLCTYLSVFLSIYLSLNMWISVILAHDARARARVSVFLCKIDNRYNVHFCNAAFCVLLCLSFGPNVDVYLILFYNFMFISLHITFQTTISIW